MAHPSLFIVDAFTSAPFGGNPASVCLVDRDLSPRLMQAIAHEMNHSETAFVRPHDGGAEQATHFSLRWFTPEVEVPLCGHATLATAHAIFTELANPALELRFETQSGTLSARREGARVALDFPAESHEEDSVRPALLTALGVEQIKWSGGARRGRNLLLQLSSESAVRSLSPDFSRLRAAREEDDFLGIIVTAAGDSGYDFVSRYFAPWVGIDEDPVTGSAHCALAPFWFRLTGKRTMRAFQASRRGGELEVRYLGERVELVGTAVTVVTGGMRWATLR